ncbi:Cas1p 10 TM acyl transferase domain-containing protein [Pelagophyceae sp. CCMP2097]|nr:Cas1p 10 TM acyl transferase domain-containing protein [Pelagophyceae sp. CCMP2097]
MMGAADKLNKAEDLGYKCAKVAATPLRYAGPEASGAAGAVVGACSAAAVCAFVGGHADQAHTPGQLAMAVLGVGIAAAWLGAEFAAAAKISQYEAVATEEATEAGLKAVPKNDARKSARDYLRAAAELWAVLAVVYTFDRTDLVPRMAKRPDTASFWKLWGLIMVVALCTVRKARVPAVLAREQTEEWKGWMQLMFLLYHYFAEAGLYNAIRVYIAAYVWMTGYGNYLYYSKTGDFSLVRVAQTLFRLNFFAIVVCVLLRNEYMLYYICPMHTLFTLFVYAALRCKAACQGNMTGALQQWWVAPATIAASLAAVIVLYDVDVVFRFAFGWWPLRPLVSFHDPLHPEFTDALHEWQFRSGLDRYIWVGGMAAAACLPFAAAAADKVARLESSTRAAATYAATLAVVLAGAAAWYANVGSLDKYAYNVKHPFTSFIPVTLYIVLRNLTPQLRGRYLDMFTYLGRVTLETYILQFHVWMKTTGVNGSPKWLARVLPEGYFWANFAVMSALYLYLSVRCFKLTVTLREVLVPSEPKLLGTTFAVTCAAVAVAYAAGYALRATMPVMPVPPGVAA